MVQLKYIYNCLVMATGLVWLLITFVWLLVIGGGYLCLCNKDFGSC